MSLDKSRRRLEKIREQNRALRKLGLLQLTEPGPWHTLGAFAFDPLAWPGLVQANPPEDKDSWPLTRA